jgi:hypothetical protein
MRLGKFVTGMILVDAIVVAISVRMGFSLLVIAGMAVATSVVCQLVYLGWIATLARGERQTSQPDTEAPKVSKGSVPSPVARHSGKRS